MYMHSKKKWFFIWKKYMFTSEPLQTLELLCQGSFAEIKSAFLVTVVVEFLLQKSFLREDWANLTPKLLKCIELWLRQCIVKRCKSYWTNNLHNTIAKLNASKISPGFDVKELIFSKQTLLWKLKLPEISGVWHLKDIQL